MAGAAERQEQQCKRSGTQPCRGLHPAKPRFPKHPSGRPLLSLRRLSIYTVMAPCLRYKNRTGTPRSEEEWSVEESVGCLCEEVAMGLSSRQTLVFLPPAVGGRRSLGGVVGHLCAAGGGLRSGWWHPWGRCSSAAPRRGSPRQC